MHPLDDQWASLLRAANAGDSRAYAAFLRAIAPPLRGLVLARGGALGPGTCEDIVQETLLAIHLKRATWREDAPVRPWLWAIARHKVADGFRARGAQVHLPIEDFADLLAAAPAPDPFEMSDALRVASRLDARSATVLTAVAIEGAGIAEAGRRLSMTKGAVRVALHRAMKRLGALRDAD